MNYNMFNNIYVIVNGKDEVKVKLGKNLYKVDLNNLSVWISTNCDFIEYGNGYTITNRQFKKVNDIAIKDKVFEILIEVGIGHRMKEIK